MNATRNLLAASALAWSVCALYAADQAGAQPYEPAGLNNEPLVIYNVSGWGIGGPMHEQLTVYSSGLASYSTGTTTGVFVLVPIERAIDLTAELHRAGGALMADAPVAGADLPLQTVTLFSAIGTNADNNTFSFYDPSDASISAVVELLDEFIAEAFTGSAGSVPAEAASGSGAQDPAEPPSTGGRPSTWGPSICQQPSTGAASTD